MFPCFILQQLKKDGSVRRVDLWDAIRKKNYVGQI